MLDPFGGGGSSFEAAQELGRLWVGSELVTVPAIVDRLRDKYPFVADQRPSAKLYSIFR